MAFGVPPWLSINSSGSDAPFEMELPELQSVVLKAPHFAEFSDSNAEREWSIETNEFKASIGTHFGA